MSTVETAGENESLPPWEQVVFDFRDGHNEAVALAHAAVEDPTNGNLEIAQDALEALDFSTDVFFDRNLFKDEAFDHPLHSPVRAMVHSLADTMAHVVHNTHLIDSDYPPILEFGEDDLEIIIKHIEEPEEEGDDLDAMRSFCGLYGRLLSDMSSALYTNPRVEAYLEERAAVMREFMRQEEARRRRREEIKRFGSFVAAATIGGLISHLLTRPRTKA